jgi:tRNA modification GTPase
VRDKNFAPKSHRATLRKLCDPDTGEALDQALVTYFKSPHSFTGEDVIEISCHGSPVLLRNLIDTSLKLDVRLAGPGEFTLRAFGNGRLNLSQAEAIRDLINAQTNAAARLATRQLGGEFSAILRPIKETLLDLIVPLESSLEFVEDDLPVVAIDRIRSDISNLILRIEKLASTFTSGRLYRDGLRVTLAGRPNVGKSSIFNALVASDRAIVTEIPGTTRDSLSEMISLQDVPILLTDTAGMRVSSDRIENLGVERTKRAIVDADLVVVVIDGSQSLTPEDEEVFNEVGGNRFLIAANKNDLRAANHENLKWGDRATSVVSISAKTEAGLDNLCAAILKPFFVSDTGNDGLLVTDARHYDLLLRAETSLRSSAELLEHRASEELILVGLYEALRYLDEITGETTPEDVLSQIFATFCIGK